MSIAKRFSCLISQIPSTLAAVYAEERVRRRKIFAVLSRGPEQYNYKEFYRNFGCNNFYKEEYAVYG